MSAFDPLNGEPAVSLIPNMLVSGVLSVVVAVAFGGLVWPWPIVVAAGSFLALVPGTVLLHVAFGSESSTPVTALTVVASFTTALAMWTVRARDRGRPPGETRRRSQGVARFSGSP